MYIKVTFEEILNAPYLGAWKDACKKYGMNEFCVNEGQSIKTSIDISLEDAEKWGLIKIEV